MESRLDLSGLLGAVREASAYRTLLGHLKTTRGNAGPAGLIRAARPAVAAALARDLGRPVILATARVDQAAGYAEQIAAWEPQLPVLIYAEPNPIFYERAAWGPRSTRSRLTALAYLAGAREGSAPPAIVVTSARALMQRTLPREELARQTLTLEVGGIASRAGASGLTSRWLAMGYEPASLVVEPGTFSRRGGILDIFPIAAEWPVRIELWDDEIDTLRLFDPASQRSLESCRQVTITLAREALPARGPEVAQRLARWLAERVGSDAADRDLTASADQRGLESGSAFPTLEFYLPWMIDECVSLLDYLPPDGLVLVDDLQDLADTIAELEAQALSLREAHTASGDIPPDMPAPLVTWDDLQDGLHQAMLVELGGTPVDDEAAPGRLFAPGPRYGGQLRSLFEEVRSILRGQRDRVAVISQQASRLADLWQEHSGQRLTPTDRIGDLPVPGSLHLLAGGLAQGWVLEGPSGRTHLLTDAEIFGWRRPEPRRRAAPRAIAPEDFFADLAPGDIAVHTEYGIGRFTGLEKRVIGGTEREFLLLAYGGGDQLYVPIHQADRLSRYVGPDDSEPELSRLGTPEWSRIKSRAREDVERKARELLALYAAREAAAGHAFSPDSPWQQELEASFPYLETPDQLTAVQDVKRDMERPRPMDRLIAGDVGYGKTEVALRAAFKAVMDGKQVAMLVPTTVLAQQHLETFTRRLAAFPVRVEMLSRFRTRAEQDDIVAGLAAGSIDIVIGTHRLLGRDVIFRDLGLLIIDEEQRFGVTHKERLKQMRTEVDVLTLTATPIPRTLYMSLTGIRDVSTIETPPEERLPVITHVGRRDDDLIRQAILREKDRGGQVFYVHNRVQTIHAEARYLNTLVPEARTGIGHGQMPEAQLEAIMDQFADGQIDVLVSTSIIEAGLDIPNANTLIVDRADQFGLAQLYQLRGRVGRSAARAYAYFFHPPLARLTPEARARLETIAEQTQLGAGMNIAMRDLEIRGAGELLGTRQHGAIAAVGFHLYTRMLAQAVQRLKREGEDGGPVETAPAAPLEAVTIDLPIPTYLPTDYIPDVGLRIQLYRRLADVASAQDIRELGAELADRFGPLPPPVENLLYQLEVKRLALLAEAEAVTGGSDQIAIRLTGLAHIDRASLQRALGHDVRVSRTAIWLPTAGGGWREALLEVLDLLAQRIAGSRARP